MKVLITILLMSILLGCGSVTVIEEELPWASSKNERIEDIKEWKNIKDWETVSVVFCGIQTRGEKYSSHKEEFNKDISNIRSLLYTKSGLRDENYSAFKFQFSEKLQKLRILGFKVKNPFFSDDEWTLFPKFNVHISDKTYEWSEDSSYDNKNHYVIYRDSLKLNKLTNLNSSRYPAVYKRGYEEESEWNCRQIEEGELDSSITKFNNLLIEAQEKRKRERIEQSKKQLEKNKI